jgi:hypothetical protein
MISLMRAQEQVGRTSATDRMEKKKKKRHAGDELEPPTFDGSEVLETIEACMP